MDQQWRQGFQDGYNNASVNSKITIYYSITGGKKVYNSHGGGAKFPQTFKHRVGAYNCGYAEGMISGFSAYATEEKVMQVCQEEGIIYKEAA